MEIRDLHNLHLWRPKPLKLIIGEGILAEGSKAVLFGDPKLGKSVLAQQMGFSIASGLPFLDVKVDPTSVLYLQAEIHPLLFKERMMKTWYSSFNQQHPFRYFTGTAIPTPKLDTEEGFNAIDKAVARCGANVLILDPLYRFATLDMEHLQRVVTNIDRLTYKHKLTIVIVHHPRKTQSDAQGNAINRGGEELWGARILEWYFDSILYLQGDIESDERTLKFILRNAIDMISYKTIKLNRRKLIFETY